MSQTLTELLAQRAELDAKIEELRKSQTAAIVEEIRKLAAEYQLSERDLFGRTYKPRAEKPAPKFKDPLSGKTWSGMGKRPHWFDAANPDSFRIPA